MKVLLVKPVNPRFFINIEGPDLGFGYLAAHLRRAGFSVAIADCLVEHLSQEQLVARVHEENADVVGFRVFTKDIPSVRESASRIRRTFPHVLLLGGGPHVSAVPEEAAGHLPELDFLIAGEAEHALPRLLQSLERRRQGSQWDRSPEGLDDVPGLVRRTPSGVMVNPPESVDLTTIGMPAWDLLKPDRFKAYALRTRGPYVPIQTTRGCSYRCAFCSVARINGRRVRLRPIPAIIEELRYLSREFGIRHFSIIDDDFLGVRRHAEAFLDALIESNLGLEWEATSNGIRLNSLTPEILQKMERSGCYSVAVAVESGSQRTLDRMRKHLTVSEIEKYTAMIAKYSRIHIHGFFILGYPGETWSDLVATVRLAWRLPLRSANFFLFTPHPGTEIYEELLRDGKLKVQDFGKFLYEVPTIDLDIPGWQLGLVQRFAFLTTHARPRILWSQLRDRPLDEVVRSILRGLNAVILPYRSKF